MRGSNGDPSELQGWIIFRKDFVYDSSRFRRVQPFNHVEFSSFNRPFEDEDGRTNCDPSQALKDGFLSCFLRPRHEQHGCMASSSMPVTFQNPTMNKGLQ